MKKCAGYGDHDFTRLKTTWQTADAKSAFTVVEHSREVLVCEKCGLVLDPLK